MNGYQEEERLGSKPRQVPLAGFAKCFHIEDAAGEPLSQARLDLKNVLNPCSAEGFASGIIHLVKIHFPRNEEFSIFGYTSFSLNGKQSLTYAHLERTQEEISCLSQALFSVQGEKKNTLSTFLRRVPYHQVPLHLLIVV